MVQGTWDSAHWPQWPDRAGYPVQRPVLVIASGNPHKVAEIGAMLDAVDLAEALLGRPLGGRSAPWLRRQRDKARQTAVPA